MPILFAISVLALVALLWAAISAARHIRRARRRRRRAMDTTSVASGRLGLQTPAPAATQQVSFEELTPYAEAVISRSTPVLPVAAPKVEMVVPEPPYTPGPAYVPKLTFAQVSPFVSVAERPVVPAMEQPDVMPLPVSAAVPAERMPAEVAPAELTPIELAPARRLGSGLFSSARIQRENEERAAAALAAPAPQAAAEQPAAEQPAAAEQLKATVPSDLPAPKKPSASLRPSSSRISLVANSGKMERPDWAYFNKDMGDLTDPYEAPRARKAASGDSRR